MFDIEGVVTVVVWHYVMDCTSYCGETAFDVGFDVLSGSTHPEKLLAAVCGFISCGIDSSFFGSTFEKVDKGRKCRESERMIEIRGGEKGSYEEEMRS